MSLGVAVLIHDETDEEPSYLMLEQQRESYGTGRHYAPPAGTMEEDIDDDPEETAVREILEETGLSVERNQLERLFETDASYGVDGLLWYRAGIEIDQEDIEINHEADDYTFLTREEALDEPLLEDTRKALKKLSG